VLFFAIGNLSVIFSVQDLHKRKFTLSAGKAQGNAGQNHWQLDCP
jgi:hypothetical protein